MADVAPETLLAPAIADILVAGGLGVWRKDGTAYTADARPGSSISPCRRPSVSSRSSRLSAPCATPGPPSCTARSSPHVSSPRRRTWPAIRARADRIAGLFDHREYTPPILGISFSTEYSRLYFEPDSQNQVMVTQSFEFRGTPPAPTRDHPITLEGGPAHGRSHYLRHHGPQCGIAGHGAPAHPAHALPERLDEHHRRRQQPQDDALRGRHPSERYGQKAAQASQKMADNYAVTFGVEAVRNNAGMFVAAQAAIRELLKIGRRTGADNLVDIQWFDALDDDVPAFQGTFRVEWDDANAGYAEALAGRSRSQRRPVPQITSPIATGVTAHRDRAARRQDRRRRDLREGPQVHRHDRRDHQGRRGHEVPRSSTTTPCRSSSRPASRVRRRSSSPTQQAPPRRTATPRPDRRKGRASHDLHRTSWTKTFTSPSRGWMTRTSSALSPVTLACRSATPSSAPPAASARLRSSPRR